MKRNIGFWIVGGIIGGVVLGGLYILATQALWNWIVPKIFHGPVISYGETIGLMLLVCMFGWIGFGKGRGGRCRKCGGGGRHKWKSKWNDKWNNMSDEEKAKWKESMHCCW